jgi:predicted dehydrogenase
MTTNGKPIRWGIAGTGTMAGEFVRGLAHAPGAVVAAVGSRDAERARAFAQRHDVARASASYDALFADRDVDVVYVATVNTTHRDLCLRALDAGKPVVCEKPFACTAAEAREVVARARERRLFCMEGMWTRFLPAVQRARELVAGGAIGDVHAFSAHLGWPHAVDARSRLFDPQQGGGALLDLGVYTISLAQLLLGPVARVQSSVRRTASGVDGTVAITLAHAGGALSSLSASLVAAATNTGVVMGSAGTLRLHAPLVRPEAFTIERAAAAGGGGRGASFVRTAARALRPLLARLRGNGPRRVSSPALGNGYAHEAIEAMRCLRAGLLESPVMPLDETVAILDVMDRVRAGGG